MSYYLCTQCGHTETRTGHNLFVSRNIPCTKCGKWTMTPISSEAYREVIKEVAEMRRDK